MTDNNRHGLRLAPLAVRFREGGQSTNATVYADAGVATNTNTRQLTTWEPNMALRWRQYPTR